jgi:aryl carrier-like protein
MMTDDAKKVFKALYGKHKGLDYSIVCRDTVVMFELITNNLQQNKENVEEGECLIDYMDDEIRVAAIVATFNENGFLCSIANVIAVFVDQGVMGTRDMDNINRLITMGRHWSLNQ